MDNKELLSPINPTPIAVGTGLVALDVVINGWESESPILSAGGSCGNVMSILAYLGWQSYPVARLGDDLTADFLIKDLMSFGVNTDLLYREKNRHTPIVIEMIPRRGTATRTHFFSFTCPHCGAPLPRHRPVLKSRVQSVLEKVSYPSVFYFDRVSRASIMMARAYQSHGSLVVFEPSSMKRGKLFQECTQVAHIVKYSRDRIDHMPDYQRGSIPLLEIDTMGAYGLRFRMLVANNKCSDWEYLETYRVDDLKDEAGSGDWCTAGIIHVFGQQGLQGFANLSREGILQGLAVGQALAAVNCRFEGARGAMYSLNVKQLAEIIAGIIEGKEVKTTTRRNIPEIADELLRSICANCRGSYGSTEIQTAIGSKIGANTARLPLHGVSLTTGRRKPKHK